MNDKQHPAVTAYASLCRQEPNRPLLDFALIQQAWLRERGSPYHRPSDYAMVLLRAMTYSFLLSQGFSEHEVRDQLVEAMEQFERQYGVLTESTVKDGEPKKMRRTRWAGAGNVIPLFSGSG